MVDQLHPWLMGWKAHFGLAQTSRIWRSLDEWLRRRLRALQLKQWRRGRTIYRELLRLGAPPRVAQSAAALSRRWWQPIGDSPDTDHCLLRQPGTTPTRLTSTSRTARCGPACREVWQGMQP
ncbi:group II intron maturase-specific domain-containing protein [Cupriavidus sp. PET2-C1]